MGDLHIYQVDGMDDYLPKISYYGNKGRLRSFLDGLSSSLFPKVGIEVLDKKKELTWLKMMNEARNLALLDKKYDLVIKKMNWYVKKINHYIANDFVSEDTLCWFEIQRLDKWHENLGVKIVISIRDDENEFIKEYDSRDFDKFKNVDDYLKRDYSDKVMTYAFNLTELYNYYLIGNDKEDLFSKTLGYYPDLRCAIHGKKCYGTGYIDWDL